jgi:hypothetical protein
MEMGGKDEVTMPSMAALAAIFHVPEDEITRLPGIKAWCSHVESQCTPLLEPPYKTLWRAERPTRSAIAWDLVQNVATTLQSAPGDSSLADLASHAAQGTGADADEALMVGFFAALCWLTMTLRPSFEADPPSLACSFRQAGAREPLCQRQHMREARRPVSRVLAAFKGNIWDDQAQSMVPASEENDTLYEGSLSFYGLHQFGRVTIEWVDVLGAHLQFDPASRCLCIFRFPSFCVLSALRRDTCPVLSRFVPPVSCTLRCVSN